MRVLCAFCLLRNGKEKSLRRSELKVHVADSYKTEKMILSDGLFSDVFSEGKWDLVSRVQQGLPEADHAKFLKGCAV